MKTMSIIRRYRKLRRAPVWGELASLLQAGERITNRRTCRVLVRSSAVGMLTLVTGYGLLAGDHLTDPSSGTRGLPAQVSSYFGYAAEQIRITGLKRMGGASVLKAIGIKPGGSLVGFDANNARSILLNLDWVQEASVRVLPPNRLEIEIGEREPFAVWQRDGNYYVIDREGAAIASFEARKFPHLMLVSGEGAQESVSQLVNQLEAWPGLHSRIKAAARVGKRRWSLYFAGGRQVLLPERDVALALANLTDLDARFGVLASGIEQVDLRIAGSAVMVPFDGANAEADRTVALRNR
ncbi:cell division protein FtsQ/DivIB [Anderseniella sp. Alg231-50]|uniref:cell division protein FtsQ/DivIB n=1 Tax=Anderseniella sp. Alg231-50 TaxID=1922226 RepID=UPI000D55CF3B